MDVEFEKNEKENQITLKKKELDVAVRIKEVELQIEEEKRRSALMEVRRQNAVKEGSFEGQAQGESVRAFMSALPDSMDDEAKIAIWTTLREMEKSAMLYSKVNEISVLPSDAELKKLQITIDSGVKPTLAENPLLLPSILGYSGERNETGSNSAQLNFDSKSKRKNK